MYRHIKRGIDWLIAMIGLLPLGVAYPVVAVAIKWDSRGPVIYKSRRVSRGRVVEIYKFRTMVEKAEELKIDLVSYNERRDGPFFKMRNDPRVTRVGRILRKFWIDEWPQLWNVWLGELSLVGPRPYPPEEIADYPREYQFLKEELAGITGLSQINGSWNLSFQEVLEYDAYYIRHKSLYLDGIILARTVLLLFRPSGV